MNEEGGVLGRAPGPYSQGFNGAMLRRNWAGEGELRRGAIHEKEQPGGKAIQVLVSEVRPDSRENLVHWDQSCEEESAGVAANGANRCGGREEQIRPVEGRR